MDKAGLIALRNSIERELREDILPFWVKYAVDYERGGFHGYISRDLTIDREHCRASVLYSRILWAFSAACGKYRDNGYLEMADRAQRYILEHFIDRESGGVFWSLDCGGNPLDTKKQIYAQAFAIYGLSEHYRATGNMESLTLAKALFEMVEERSRDRAGGGYLEALSRDWSALVDMSLSAKDMNAAKTMNTHLHLLEAYARLYGIWKDKALKESLTELLDVIPGRIITGDYSFGMFFDIDWKPLSGTVSFGHDIEGSWLLCEAAEALGDPLVLRHMRAVAGKMAARVLAHGLDTKYGGVYNENGAESPLDTDKVWWVQAEAMVGFANAYELTGKRDYLDAAAEIWRFIGAHIIDKQYGEWVWQSKRDGAASPPDEKAGPWKCPYHNARMCLQMVERLDRIAKGWQG